MSLKKEIRREVGAFAALVATCLSAEERFVPDSKC